MGEHLAETTFKAILLKSLTHGLVSLAYIKSLRATFSDHLLFSFFAKGENVCVGGRGFDTKFGKVCFCKTTDKLQLSV